VSNPTPHQVSFPAPFYLHTRTQGLNRNNRTGITRNIYFSVSNYPNCCLSLTTGWICSNYDKHLVYISAINSTKITDMQRSVCEENVWHWGIQEIHNVTFEKEIQRATVRERLWIVPDLWGGLNEMDKKRKIMSRSMCCTSKNIREANGGSNTQDATNEYKNLVTQCQWRHHSKNAGILAAEDTAIRSTETMWRCGQD